MRNICGDARDPTLDFSTKILPCVHSTVQNALRIDTVVEEAEVDAAVVLGGARDALMRRWLDKPHVQDRGTREV